MLALKVAIELRSRQEYVCFWAPVFFGAPLPKISSYCFKADRYTSCVKFRKDPFRGVNGIDSIKSRCKCTMAVS